MEFEFDWSFFVLVELIEELKEGDPKDLKCLDIGSGAGIHTNILRQAGCNVTQLDKYSPNAEIQEGFLEHAFEESYDIVFCSHVIEHQRNCGLFFDKIFDVLEENGRLVMSAPKHPATTMIEGHINSFILPIFLQQLIYAGFDCNRGKLLSCGGIENSVIVPKADNYDLKEREHDAYEWTSAHQQRSFVKLENQQFDNNQILFRNCIAWARGENNNIQLTLRNIKTLGITLKSSRWGISVTV